MPDVRASGLREAARERALAWVQARRLVRPGDRVLIATGGGPRSLGLMNFFREVRDELGVGSLAVAAVEPNTREDSDAAEVVADVGRLARALGMDFHAVRPSPMLARIEVMGELSMLAREQGFDRIALGNTRDDDAVRVLSELARGGMESVRGLAPRLRGGFVRPFLVLSDAEAMALTPDDAAGWAAGVSPVNEDEEAVRREILPRLRARFASVDMMLQECGRSVRARRASPARNGARRRG